MFNFTPSTSHTRVDADRRVASLFLKRFAARCTSANSAVKARFLSHDASRTSMETCTRSSLRWNTSLGEKAAGRPLPKTLALRPREACKTAPNKECRYHIASKSLTARVMARQPQPYVTHLVGQKVRPPGGLEIKPVFGCVLSISHCYLRA